MSLKPNPDGADEPADDVVALGERNTGHVVIGLGCLATMVLLVVLVSTNNTPLPGPVWALLVLCVIAGGSLGLYLLFFRTPDLQIDFGRRIVDHTNGELSFDEITGLSVEPRSTGGAEQIPRFDWLVSARTESEGEVGLHAAAIDELYPPVRRLSRESDVTLDVTGARNVGAEGVAVEDSDVDDAGPEEGPSHARWSHEQTVLTTALVFGGSLALGVLAIQFLRGPDAEVLYYTIAAATTLPALYGFVRPRVVDHLFVQGEHELVEEGSTLVYRPPNESEERWSADEFELVVGADEIWQGVVLAGPDRVEVLPCKGSDLQAVERDVAAVVRAGLRGET